MIGLASSGPHSNGYSLIRKLLEIAGANAAPASTGSRWPIVLLTPTRIYVKIASGPLGVGGARGAGMAHITGGGLNDNIPRVVPDGFEVGCDRRGWPRDPVFDWLAHAGNVGDTEMHRTFNCGIGMVVVAPPGRRRARTAARGR